MYYTFNIRRTYKVDRSSVAAQFNTHFFLIFLFKLNSKSAWNCLLPLDSLLLKEYFGYDFQFDCFLIEIWIARAILVDGAPSGKCQKGRFSYEYQLRRCGNLIWDLSHGFETNHFDFWLRNNSLVFSFFCFFFDKNQTDIDALINWLPLTNRQLHNHMKRWYFASLKCGYTSFWMPVWLNIELCNNNV